MTLGKRNELITKEVETVKKNQQPNLELKNSVNEVNNTIASSKVEHMEN